MIGDGSGISIISTSSSTLSNTHSFHLNNVFCSPKISLNLLKIIQTFFKTSSHNFLVLVSF